VLLIADEIQLKASPTLILFVFVLRGRRGTHGSGRYAWIIFVAPDPFAFCVAIPNFLRSKNFSSTVFFFLAGVALVV
jgi:hypothetical protein